MGILILDPVEADEIRERYLAEHPDRPTEVWEGVTVVPPLANDEHQEVQLALMSGFYDAIQVGELGQVRPAVNLSDRADGWEHNYRNPDGVVYLDGNPAVNHGTHWQGGPDLAVEIISPGEDPQAKFAFYAGVGTRGILVVHRNPWAVELFRLQNGRYTPVGCSDATTAAATELAFDGMPLAVRLEPGVRRPTIVLRHTADGRTWTA